MGSILAFRPIFKRVAGKVFFLRLLLGIFGYCLTAWWEFAAHGFGAAGFGVVLWLSGCGWVTGVEVVLWQRVFEKSLQYVKRFSRYKNPDAVRQAREYPLVAVVYV
ncbi:hypothetical protein RHMOL_Rhmol02G0090900 [Rhododendron molle]|uniref:Uncharacterized protein n=1 Tax=Rhododendron molle TaxID=49168 RepID=A0ACC0PPJ3_RHOML|nr:hypothetical protein RHMOL_Rhmol02G0090900 [Rhododendron molle]